MTKLYSGFWPNNQKKYEHTTNDEGCSHNLEGPAFREWHNNGQLSKICYYVHGTKHRADGPAVVLYHENGEKYQEEYWVNGVLHKVDGPAIIKWDTDGQQYYRGYWVNDVELSEEDFLIRYMNVTFWVVVGCKTKFFNKDEAENVANRLAINYRGIDILVTEVNNSYNTKVVSSFKSGNAIKISFTDE